MIDFDFIERLIRALDDSSIDSLEIEKGGTRVRLSKSPTTASGPVVVSAPVPVPALPAPATQSAAPVESSGLLAPEAPAASTPAPSNLVDITSPMVGTFYRAPAPDVPSFVDVGARVKPGDALCIIEAMKLMNELESEITGTIVEVCIENAQPVEFGQVLFRVDPS
jgi:acetyl-CoA carboxylase biotin carboxyl carrier protein